VIVTVGGWLYIINALLALWSLKAPMPFGGGPPIAASLFAAALFGSVGVGLLTRQNWARWLALGMSLLSWTLGTASLLYVLPDVLRVVAFASGGIFAFLLVIIAILAVLVAVVIIINFKLFHYLISDAGKDEFNTPEFESHAVLKSSGVYVVVLLAFFMADRQASMSAVNSMAMERAARDAQDLAEEERRREMAHREAMNRDAEQREQEEERVLEPAADSVQYAAVSDAPSAAAEPPPLEAEAEPETNKILKCRDPSGAISFTQGYCPAGTQRVETPQTE
jgi:hypothetical protein